MNKEILEITKEFHDTYEKLASEYTYETREDTKVFDINSNNGKLMYATVNEIVSPILKENKILRENSYHNDKVVDKVNLENQLLKKELEEYKNPIKYFKYANKNVTEENKQLKDLIDTILNFSFFKEECPLNFSFKDNSKEDKAQDVFYEDEYCENACNDDYRKCWLKYFEKMQELEKGDSNE